MNRPPLIIWREVMPDVEKGAFGFVSENWGNKVMCFYLKEPLKERIECGWGEHSYAKVEVVYIPEGTNSIDFIDEIVNQYPDAIHLFFGGLRHSLKKYLDAYIKRVSETKLVEIAEKPLLTGRFKLLRKIAKKTLYKILFKKYNKHIDVLLAMGEKGVNRYLEYGFNRAIYPFMYNPVLNIDSKSITQNDIIVNHSIKFLYIGRFDYKFKGCQYLIKTFDDLSEELNGKWELTLVGGYGTDKDEIIEWANKKNYVSYGGSWEQKDIIHKMSAYDICLVPSIEDGWNLTPNFAIHAHVGSIISDEATSHELIEASNAGVVYKYNDLKALKWHIENAINNHEIVVQWKKNTFPYLNRISSNNVGSYFIDIMDYTFFNTDKKPICPWTNH